MARAAGVFLGVVFLVAAIQKAGDPAGTVNALQAGLGIGQSQADASTRVLIFGEILLGSWLISGYRARWSLLAGALLLGVFTLWNASFLVRGIRADCGCGFSEANPSLERGQWIATLRSGLFGLIGVVGLVSGRAVQSTEFETQTRKKVS